jgi:bacterioferritin-associated ferredoxin
MIVCLCRGVSDRTIRALIAAGARTHDEVNDACGAGGDCGRCRTDLTDLLEDSRGTGHRTGSASPYLPERALT